jgi:hypothetical protein
VQRIQRIVTAGIVHQQDLGGPQRLRCDRSDRIADRRSAAETGDHHAHRRGSRGDFVPLATFRPRDCPGLGLYVHADSGRAAIAGVMIDPALQEMA